MSKIRMKQGRLPRCFRCGRVATFSVRTTVNRFERGGRQSVMSDTTVPICRECLRNAWQTGAQWGKQGTLESLGFTPPKGQPS